MIEQEFPPLTEILQSRLNMIIQEVSRFWEQGPHSHFTFHGPQHSQRIHSEKLAQLALQLPDNGLTEDERFIVSAAAWLYDIGVQCTDFRHTSLNITWKPGVSLSPVQLQQIREHKHELTYHMITDSVRHDYDGPRLQLGLSPDEYTRAIAEVCRGCSNESIYSVPETRPVNGVKVRIRLLAAILRLADQLYIDHSRVNIDLLQKAHLTPREKARWWAYHYTLTLPIDRQGRILFYYYLPDVHRPLLNHIRTLIEPDFRHTSNPVINYLLDQHNLRLIPHNEPEVDYDLPSGFRREMSDEMVMYLRSIEVDKIIQGSGIRPPEPTPTRERNLLVLDYENFILQLGLEGYFPTLDDISRMVFTLSREARSQYYSPVEGLVAGHLNRPDLLPVANLLREVGVYQLLEVEDHQKSSEALLLELHQRLKSTNLPKQVILVAPQKKMASITQSFDERGQTFSAWLGNSSDADVYYSLVHQFRSLSEVLNLSGGERLEPEELEIAQAACILRLEDRMRTDKNGISFEAASAVLKQVESIKGRTDWWRLYLIHQDILKPLRLNNGYILQLNTAHPRIGTTDKKRDVIIKALQFLGPGGAGVQQGKLLKELANHPAFPNGEQEILAFLALMQDEMIVSVDTLPASQGGQTVWQLNITHWAVIALNADRFLPLLVLGLDHTMVRFGFPVIHEHTLQRRLQPYMENNAAEAAYQLALKREWVKRQEVRDQGRQSYRTEPQVAVELVAEREEIQRILLNRDILLDVLRRATYGGGLQRDALKSQLSRIQRFTLKLNDVDDWLDAFQSDSLILVEKDTTDMGCDCIRLNLDIPLVQYLLGRMHVCGIIMVMRILRATTAETGKTTNEVIDMLAHRVTHGDRKMGAWTLDYAKNIRLIGLPRTNVPDAPRDLVTLNKHRVVEKLERREFQTCQALGSLLGTLSRPHLHDGWVPQRVLVQEMERNSQQFGYTHDEHEFWINRAMVRYKKLETKTEPGRPPQSFMRPLSQERH